MYGIFLDENEQYHISQNQEILQSQIQFIEHQKSSNGPVILYISNPEMKKTTQDVFAQLRLAKQEETAFDFVEVSVKDWDRYLTPWPAKPCIKNRVFLGEGAILLKEIETFLDKNSYKPNRMVILAGYSLGGLFSLWAAYESGKKFIHGVVCVSGSLWYPDWDAYADTHNLDKDIKVYMSLGDKESNTKHSLMSQVGECTKRQVARLSKENYVKFEWNAGGHFSEVVERMVKGIVRI